MVENGSTEQEMDRVVPDHSVETGISEMPLHKLKSLVPSDCQSVLSSLGNTDCLRGLVLESLPKCLKHLQADDFRSCVDLSDMLLDLIWEKLNTGHWKNVPLEWRHAYTLCSAVKAYGECGLHNTDHQSVSRSTVMKTLDMGLLMGAPLWNNILAKMCQCIGQVTLEKQPAEKLDLGNSGCNDGEKLEQTNGTVGHGNTNSKQSKDRKSLHHLGNSEMDDCPGVKRRKTIEYPCIDESKSIPRCSCPSIERFQTEFWSRRKPVIITDAIGFWPALSSRCWTLDYIRQVAGCRTVPIELGSKYTEDAWTQTLMTIGDFIDRYIEQAVNSTVGYLAQHQLFEQVPELMRDFSIPAYCSVGADPEADPDVNAWFGPAGTVSPLHYDDKHNLLTQVMGEKYLRLYAPEYTEHVYPHSSWLLFNTSQVDVENLDVERFPLFRQAPFTECVLREGEMLYLPPGHWHFVKSLATSFSISFWWPEADAEAAT